ncbi:glucose-6-phosphate isomerase [Phycisphaera mikurensis]|uniref:Glucose-6-phosphate isomerase n=1 Tax=Phycisphaera mikurensis (strain NBRC 102666 / KCTC 22515 / FYK2301M01) TaxID=1142394 RepID=I0II20_PHYMF|nr:glucose-6-phosphate isomerase [Phycisphaera mikurensis]MBB6442528.1 glucose-6-phosphate isomerase [Phycisphaera mikurensis]BAM04908.1 glucose-6-phosphate isomerase [Phycisphaera mikurensis NBRC 102666]
MPDAPASHAAPTPYTPRDAAALWKRYQNLLVRVASVGLSLDVSRMEPADGFWKRMEPRMQEAFAAMEKLEEGAIANPDEGRRVGHYWLRDPGLAPEQELTEAIERTIHDVKGFAASVHSKEIAPPDEKAPRFTDLLSIGIGGSALGPQLVADALGVKRDKMKVHFIDNTDTDGIRRTLENLGSRLKSTLVLVVSKSGGTPEPRNGMVEAKAAFRRAGLDFAKQAVAITGEGSKLDGIAKSEGWLRRFPMFDWVGGRTSVMATVGLVPAALQGIDVDRFLLGARKMDAATRNPKTAKNPAAMLALMWFHATGGTGEKDMVVLPYKDRLLLLSRYLQQLVMESLGKELDLDGNVVHQGIAVYGNKGSTDQHAYVQQLRDGTNNFFATFVTVLQDTPRAGRDPVIDVDGGEHVTTSGDYLTGFYLGTRKALYENGRESMTITLDKLDAQSLGAVIALYERAVGLYASLVNVNAYHQPGVEAGKKAAAGVLDLQNALLDRLTDKAQSAEALAAAAGQPDQAETALHLLEHLAANKRIAKRAGKYLKA